MASLPTFDRKQQVVNDMCAVRDRSRLQKNTNLREERNGELTLGGATLLLGDLLLDLERLGLKAEIGDLELVCAVDGDLAVGAGKLGAAVSKTSALDLLVGEGAHLVGGDSVGSLSTEEQGHGEGASDGLLHALVLRRHGAGSRAGLFRVEIRKDTQVVREHSST
jgi:hypothetical protein